MNRRVKAHIATAIAICIALCAAAALLLLGPARVLDVGLPDTSDDGSSDSASEDGPTCVPSGGDDHVCDEAVPAKWHTAFERWSKLVTKAAQAKSHRQAATSLRKAKVVLRRMHRMTSKFERGGTVSDDCLGKLRSRLEALSTETRRIAG